MVARTRAIGRARRSLLLADGDLEIPRASDSLILATGKVSIAYGERYRPTAAPLRHQVSHVRSAASHVRLVTSPGAGSAAVTTSAHPG